MIKNDFRTKEFKKEKQKYQLAHLDDQCDHASHGKIMKYRFKHPKQVLDEDWDSESW